MIENIQVHEKQTFKFTKSRTFKFTKSRNFKFTKSRTFKFTRVQMVPSTVATFTVSLDSCRVDLLFTQLTRLRCPEMISRILIGTYVVEHFYSILAEDERTKCRSNLSVELLFCPKMISLCIPSKHFLLYQFLFQCFSSFYVSILPI